MRKIFKQLLVIAVLVPVFSGAISAQVIFSDDFESGTTKWVLEGQWGTTDAQSVSPNKSLTESPSGNYGHNWNISATMANGVDLTTAIGAEVTFWARYDIEVGLEFDNMYLEATEDGTTWTQLARFEGEDVPWTQYSYQLDGFLGSPDVKLRFRFFSDPAYRVDGMYIDDFKIISSAVDTVSPLIVHSGPDYYEGVEGAFDVLADIDDVSGIQSAEVNYKVDGGIEFTLAPRTIENDLYTFTIPQVQHGSVVEYNIIANDTKGNATQHAKTYTYISGSHVFYDNPTVSYLQVLNAGSGAAVRISMPAGNERLVTALIRNYTDIDNPNDVFEFHVWADNGGVPGADLITPFIVTPEANLQVTSPMTRIDLRSYTTELVGLTGNIFIGFTVPSGKTNITKFSPETANRSLLWDGESWSSAGADFHFRVVVTDEEPLPVELTSFSASLNENSVLLSWNTATEINNYGFEIERADKNNNWQKIGFVNGAGNSNSPKQYSFSDNQLSGTEYSYRLKQIDIDGQFEYSDIVEVKGIPVEYKLSQNYPNPFNPTTKISFSIPKRNHVSLKIYDALGTEIKELVNGITEAGSYEMEFDASNLPSGIYFYNLSGGDFTQTKKMMLLK